MAFYTNNGLILSHVKHLLLHLSLFFVFLSDCCWEVAAVSAVG